MKFSIIYGKLGMSGQNIGFENETFYSLKVGDFITQIGNGKENGTIRTDNFDTPIRYVGSIICNFSKPEKMYAFELSEKHNSDNLYLLYGDTGCEIFTEAVFSYKDRTTKKTSSYMRFYAPCFKIV
ncbi:hypothetical protein Pedsa_0889 [Pseudopedobacter saltans DSM 12145]|uniref:Uncharacterized protein n=1 Tax=Pseudopedobacter saltans (strain ATCC 51119 / DSM 12145 / JCM 21818 / CCUG 39354 / LMG 10337 / NBRC 100064 / NCIMB 13643) TaxID=762903 RepID=F0SA84_PSESL|nr:hypothetical protein [Pseudopedobacter saltans]ADY51461.1 hypothetical protein Pedsa_0889 [Pseudopedobacter saltans DSM 12145]